MTKRFASEHRRRPNSRAALAEIAQLIANGNTADLTKGAGSPM
jgi:hypothetical protein